MGATFSAVASTSFALPTARAAEWLAEHAPIRSAAQWSAWLRHNNRPGRHVRYRMRAQRIGNCLLFTMEELARVRKFEMERASRNGYSEESLRFLIARREEIK